jgi:hypothetical protein
MAKIMAANNIHTSPMLKEMPRRVESFPFVIRNRTPPKTSVIPTPFLMVMNSLKRILEKRRIKIGNVMEISERFMAVVVCPAK